MSKNCVLVLLLGIVALNLLYLSRLSFTDFAQKIKIKRYLVETPKCKILDVPPFYPQVWKFYHREEYKPCGPSDLLTYVTVNNNTATLHVNEEVVKKYHKKIVCFYQNIEDFDFRFPPEDHLNQPGFTLFETSVEIDFDFVSVICLMENKVFYSNTHAPIILQENIIERQEFMKHQNEAFSVLIIGIDSMSRLNFLRSLPETHLFLKRNNWISLKGYNKVADNTHPNLMALLTGLDEYESEKKCGENLTNCPLLLSEYHNLGYATAYAEDEPWLGNFIRNHDHPLIDYYFWPYFRINQKLTTRKIDGMNFCTGPENTGERVLNLAKNFAKILQNRPSFGVFWMNSFSHSNLNLASSMDTKIRDFFANISDSGSLEKTFVFFLSDHGLRTGPFRQTPLGWFEERLPFCYILVPVKFRDKFRRQYHNLQLNINQLTSPYHLYVTLQDILVLSKQNYKIKSSQGCSKCQSLFDSFEDRSCQDAGIDPHWCTCHTYPSIIKQSILAQNASKYVLRYIHTKILHQNGARKCLKYRRAKIISTRISDDHKYILLIFETSPKAVFEATVLYQPGSKQTFSVKGEISRLDRYAKHSYCTSNRLLRKLCYCR
ncbi:uncharacterized protein LOC123016066 [Tribolium madens]|uniref:uncharacterized protein LOC123016066 n=1 Tax=Tribolium madens TaxID=41895 RepID=UPI001CF75929|nr:uncharacterized protein LOC123016066 [Tribolium madens]